LLDAQHAVGAHQRHDTALAERCRTDERGEIARVHRQQHHAVEFVVGHVEAPGEQDQFLRMLQFAWGDADAQCRRDVAAVMRKEARVGQVRRSLSFVGRRPHHAVAVDDAHRKVGAVGEHAIALEVLDQGRAARLLPAMLQLHRHLVHLADRARDVLLVRVGVGAGVARHHRIRAVPFGISTRQRDRPDACAQQQRERGPEIQAQQVHGSNDWH
jgi:hypothetical protein